MYKLHQHQKTHRFIGNDYECIDEIVHIFDPTTYGKFTIITQRKAIGNKQFDYRTYNREGMRVWEDDTKDKRKKEIIREVKEWFDTTTFEWLNF